MNRPLYERLPEIYRIKDGEQDPPGQLAALLEPVEQMFDILDRSMVELYHDFFIETCADWAIPYLGAQLGVSPLHGDTWAQRADVADTMAIRRRKGTLAGLGLAVHSLTGWGFRLRELYRDLARCQHLNHLRPESGPQPIFASMDRFTTPPGGTANLRAPHLVQQTGGPWEILARLPDLRRADGGQTAVNLPNLGIFLWRLQAYRLPLIRPYSQGTVARGGAIDLIKFPNSAEQIARFEISRLGRPQALFGVNPNGMDEDPPRFPERGELPGQIPLELLNEGQPGCEPYSFVSITTYDETQAFPSDLQVGEKALQLNLPRSFFGGSSWAIRGANLCAWEEGLYPPLASGEIAIDPRIGRVVFGIDTVELGQSLKDHLWVTCHLGSCGPIGGLPESRQAAPSVWASEETLVRRVNGHLHPNGLAEALDDVHLLSQPLIVEIEDSLVHELDLTSLSAHTLEDGEPALKLGRSLIVRAASGQAPIVRLAQGLAFRPAQVVGSDAIEQNQIDALNSRLGVRLEGLYLTRGEAMIGPLINRAAVNALEIWNTTLDPGGTTFPHEKAEAYFASLGLGDTYGFADPEEEAAFKERPQILLRQVLCGSLFLRENYRLHLEHCIVHAGSILSDSVANYAISGSASDPDKTWGPEASFNGVTLFGRARLAKVSGKGGIFGFPLEVHEHVSGCIKRSFFAASGNRLPQHHDCLSARSALLGFTSQSVNDPALGQLTQNCDPRLRERGPNDCAMGAWGFLQEAHKWRNLELRFRELMPVGIRPILISMN